MNKTLLKLSAISIILGILVLNGSCKVDSFLNEVNNIINPTPSAGPTEAPATTPTAVPTATPTPTPVYLLVHLSGDDTTGASSAGANPFKTIQGAINFAGTLSDKVVIKVAAGTYTENLTLNRSHVTIMGGYNSSDWNTKDQTGRSDSVNKTQISGFISINTATNILIDCFVIYEFNCQSTISGVSAVTIANSQITLEGTYYGEAIRSEDAATVLKLYNNMIDTSGSSYAGGGASCIFVSGQNTEIINNLIKLSYNSAYSAISGGGTIYNNTIIGEPGGTGTGIIVDNSITADIRNNIFVKINNDVSIGATGGLSFFAHNCIYGNTPASELSIDYASGTDLTVNDVIALNTATIYGNVSLLVTLGTPPGFHIDSSGYRLTTEAPASLKTGAENLSAFSGFPVNGSSQPVDNEQNIRTEGWSMGWHELN